jgi:hypothetical protein
MHSLLQIWSKTATTPLFVHLQNHLRNFIVLMSNRDVIVKRLVMSINQINRWVDVVFPELRQVFNYAFTKPNDLNIFLLPVILFIEVMKSCE